MPQAVQHCWPAQGVGNIFKGKESHAHQCSAEVEPEAGPKVGVGKSMTQELALQRTTDKTQSVGLQLNRSCNRHSSGCKAHLITCCQPYVPGHLASRWCMLLLGCCCCYVLLQQLRAAPASILQVPLLPTSTSARFTPVTAVGFTGATSKAARLTTDGSWMCAARLSTVLV